MSLEVITDINMNFTNGAGGHTASVTSSLDVKKSDGSPTLGIVGGEIGDKNLFSDSRINKLLGRFVCTSKTTSKNPVGTVITRNYSDITSLTLNSYLVLVRGINAPPVDGDSYSGSVPYFSEVTGSPLAPFPSLGIKELDNKRILVAGKIYNYETAANFQGVKISLVYQNGQLVSDLCLNQDMVQTSYLLQPDLAQYDLKFGYTLTEYLQMLEAAGIKQSGLEKVNDADKILFEASGTLASVTGTIASYFGFYYFVNPNTGVLEFIDSRIAATMPVTDFTQATEDNIVSATFTEDKFAPQDVNVYIGQTEKQGEGEKSPAKDDRPKPIYLKNVDLLDLINPQFGREIYEALFIFFAQDAGTEAFDKYVLFLLILNKIGNEQFDWVDFGDLYDVTLGDEAKTRRKFSPDIKGGPAKVVYEVEQKNPLDLGEGKFQAVVTNDTPKGFDNRILDKCEYFGLVEQKQNGVFEALTKMPSQVGKKGGLYDYLKGFFDFAGGLYISNGYSEYKAERMNFQNTNNVTMLGPFRKDEKLVDIKELEDVSTFVKNYGTKKWKDMTIQDLFNASRGQAKATAVNPYFFIAKEPWGKMFLDVQEEQLVDFSPLSDFIEIISTAAGQQYIGGPRRVLDQDLLNWIITIRNNSKAKFDLATTNAFGKKSIKLTYIRSKTPVNEVADGDEKRENQILTGSNDSQKIQELLDRYDLKNYIIDAPKTEQYMPLSLNSANGSTTEMQALRDTANKDYLTILNTPLKSSQKSVYGLEIPETFNITVNSFSLTVGADGITTTIGESSLKLIPPDREFTVGRGMETIGKPLVNRRFTAAQRNYLGL